MRRGVWGMRRISRLMLLVSGDFVVYDVWVLVEMSEELMLYVW